MDIVTQAGATHNYWSSFVNKGEIENHIYLVRKDNKVILINKNVLSENELLLLRSFIQDIETEQLETENKMSFKMKALVVVTMITIIVSLIYTGIKIGYPLSNGEIFRLWFIRTVPKEAHVIRELTVGKEYTLVETKPADGYVTAESVKFTIKDTADVQKVEMKDDVTKVKISKQDIAGKELPGAKLTILDQDGKVVESWTSTEKAHYIEMLPIGKYTLREETAPDGYLVAKDVEFEVKDTCEVQHVTMVDEKKPAEKTPEGGKPVSDSPKTRDNTNLWLWFMLLGIGATGTGALAFMRKKKH